jgi:hypothetical protein
MAGAAGCSILTGESRNCVTIAAKDANKQRYEYECGYASGHMHRLPIKFSSETSSR